MFGCWAVQKMGTSVMLLGATTDAATERAERFMKVHLRFPCEQSQEGSRSSQHHL